MLTHTHTNTPPNEPFRVSKHLNSIHHKPDVCSTGVVRKKRREERLTFDRIHTEGGGGSISTLRWQKIDVLPDG